MKLFVIVAIILWLVCGLAGDWMIHGGDDLRWKSIARGPITLIKAFNEDPVTIPTEN